MKIALVAVLVLAAQVASAHLIEDGSAFTGTFQTNQDLCKEKRFNYQTGKYDLIDSITITGTIGGPSFDGNTPALASGNPKLAKPGSGVTSYAQYLSPTEFYDEGAVHFEHDGAAPFLFSTRYIVSADGSLTITRTSTSSIASPVENSTCYFVRLPSSN